jgi:ribonuclease HI
MIDVYTDGGSSGNPGPGGWAFVVLFPDGSRVERSGGSGETTNNRMELEAVIRALEFLLNIPRVVPGRAFGEGREVINLHTDSQYVQLGISRWIHTWVRNGWKTSGNKAVKNQELWKRLHELTQQFQLRWVWIKGHAGDPHNERCDRLVQKEIKKIKETQANCTDPT